MRILLLSIVALLGLSSCQVEKFELEIERDFRADHENPYSIIPESQAWVDQGNGLYKMIMRIPPSFLMPPKGGAGGGGNDDPFADPFAPSQEEYKSKIKDWSAKSTDEVIREMIPLESTDGGSIEYDYATQLLTIIESPKNIEFIKSVLSPLCDVFEKQIAVRAEIYEMPRALAIQLLESAATEGEHSPERNAAMKAVFAGKADLVSSPSIIVRGGQRSRVFGGSEFFEKSDADDSENKVSKSAEADFFAGTSLEVDPVLGADNWTIDLNLSLEHHSMPSGLGKSDDSARQIHKNSITTQLTLHNGNYILIGNWTPSEQRLSNDLEQVVFITGSIQTMGSYGPIRDVK